MLVFLYSFLFLGFCLNLGFVRHNIEKSSFENGKTLNHSFGHFSFFLICVFLQRVFLGTSVKKTGKGVMVFCKSGFYDNIFFIFIFFLDSMVVVVFLFVELLWFPTGPQSYQISNQAYKRLLADDLVASASKGSGKNVDNLFNWTSCIGMFNSALSNTFSNTIYPQLFTMS